MRDLGFVIGRKDSAKSNGSGLAKSETAQLMSGAHAHTNTAATKEPKEPTSAAKRPSSPDHRRRDDSRSGDYGPPSKRQRPASPTRSHGHDRDRWDGPGRRRYASPSPWDRERERDSSTHGRRFEKEKEEDKSTQVPPVLSWFVGLLPPPASFDGTHHRMIQLWSHN